MKKLVFVHGWGFSSDFWSLLINELSEYSAYTIDLGFVGHIKQDTSLIQKIYNHPEEYIAVGHSLGFLYLLKYFPLKFNHYVAINSFAKFSKCISFPNGIAHRVIDRMITGLETDAYKVIHQFQKQCGIGDVYKGYLDIAKLKEGLEFLKYEDYRDVIPIIDTRLTLVASMNDPIVSNQMFINSFIGQKYCYLNDDTHILPISQSKQCAKIIRNIGAINE